MLTAMADLKCSCVGTAADHCKRQGHGANTQQKSNKPMAVRLRDDDDDDDDDDDGCCCSTLLRCSLLMLTRRMLPYWRRGDGIDFFPVVVLQTIAVVYPCF